MITWNSYTAFICYTIISNKGFLIAVLSCSISQYLQKHKYSASMGIETCRFEIPIAESTVFITCMSELMLKISYPYFI